jgi:tellurite resistance-related uncharacterized protein
MERAITGYHLDELDDWVAELACGHDQHVRHRPPFEDRPWVVDEAGRTARSGTPLDCPLCDRAELPESVHLVRSSPAWTERSMPAGLRRRHRLAAGTWGRITVHQGRLRFEMACASGRKVDLTGPGALQAIPPEIEHEVEPVGSVRFIIDFFKVDRTAPPADQAGPPDAVGGDPACWAGLLCPECGIVLDGSAHRPGCGFTAHR